MNSPSGTPAQADRERSSKGERTRARLLAAARLVFERDGYIQARVVDIVGEAGVAHGTFYTYFTSKQDVFIVCEREVTEALMKAYELPPNLDPIERIRVTNEQFIGIYEENSRMLALLEHAAEIDPDLRELRLSIRSAFTDRLETAIGRMNELGRTQAPRLDPHTAAHALGSMIDNVCYVWFGLGEDFDRATMLETLDVIWMRALSLEPDRARS
jgi:AcrR family transcriptional regulator